MTDPYRIPTLEEARAHEAATRRAFHAQQTALRRFARDRGIASLRAARWELHETDLAAWRAYGDAQARHRAAVRQVRRIALLTALQRVVDTDHALRAPPAVLHGDVIAA